MLRDKGNRRALFTAEQRRALLLANGCASPALNQWNERQTANCETADPVNQASALELGGYLSNTLLRDTDSMSMAHGLEVRVPLIDHKIVERMMAILGLVTAAPSSCHNYTYGTHDIPSNRNLAAIKHHDNRPNCGRCHRY